ncbi:MAG: hypothetical protein MJ225_02020 [Bacilli bacterium]|nr:hypothetical protein [Bacilli bacterium]
MKLSLIEKLIRKNKDVLATCGYGIIVFLLWGIVKTVIWAYDILPTYYPTMDGQSAITYVSIYTTTYSLFYIFSVLTGIFSIQEGKKDKKRGLAICILSIPLAITSILSTGYDLYAQITSRELDLLYVAFSVFEVIFLYFIIRLIISAFLLRRYENLIKEGKYER